MDLIQIRQNVGGLEYRSRVCERVEGGSQLILFTDDWGPWQKVEAIRGDESDRERWGE